MKTPSVVCSLLALGAVFASCSSEEAGSAAPTSRPSAAGSQPSSGVVKSSFDPAFLAAVWPEQNSVVFESFDMLVGPSEIEFDGSFALLLGDPVPAGQVVEPSGSRVQLFPEGRNHGPVVLPTGEQTLTVQLLDANRKSLGADHAHSVTYNVVETPDDLGVHFVEPKDGATVKSPVRFVFGVSGMTMSPATENVLDKTRGHHHLLVNLPPMTPGLVIPMDATHLHYGKAQTETEVALEPGEYSLTMQYADGNHRSYGERMAAGIKITVE